MRALILLSIVGFLMFGAIGWMQYDVGEVGLLGAVGIALVGAALPPVLALWIPLMTVPEDIIGAVIKAVGKRFSPKDVGHGKGAYFNRSEQFVDDALGGRRAHYLGCSTRGALTQALGPMSEYLLRNYKSRNHAVRIEVVQGHIVSAECVPNYEQLYGLDSMNGVCELVGRGKVLIGYFSDHRHGGAPAYGKNLQVVFGERVFDLGRQDVKLQYRRGLKHCTLTVFQDGKISATVSYDMPWHRGLMSRMFGDPFEYEEVDVVELLMCVLKTCAPKARY